MNSMAAINNMYDNFQGPTVSTKVMFYWDQPFLVGGDSFVVYWGKPVFGWLGLIYFFNLKPTEVEMVLEVFAWLFGVIV